MEYDRDCHRVHERLIDVWVFEEYNAGHGIESECSVLFLKNRTVFSLDKIAKSWEWNVCGHFNTNGWLASYERCVCAHLRRRWCWRLRLPLLMYAHSCSRSLKSASANVTHCTNINIFYTKYNIVEFKTPSPRTQIHTYGDCRTPTY